MSFAQIKNDFFVAAADAVLPSRPVPATYADCRIKPIIDCEQYNYEIGVALAGVGTGATPADNADHFIFIANWWLGLVHGTYTPAHITGGNIGPEIAVSAPYYLDGPGGSQSLLDILKQKAQAGVDVRVLGWVSFAVMGSAIAQRSGADTFARVNSLTMKSIQELRAEPTIGPKALLNVISHSAGAVHSKFVVVGKGNTAVAFTGGLDFQEDRWSRPGHFGLDETWHDVMARVEGPAVQSLYDLFRDMFNENMGRNARQYRFENADLPSRLTTTTAVPPLALSTAAVGRHHVQSLRTVPQFNYARYNVLPENQPISFAPDGLFEYATALNQAIGAARRYIYIEDQSFWSQEILGWVNQAVQARPDLRVILLTSGGGDPNDPAIPDAFLSTAINDGLCAGLTAAQQDRVRMYLRMGDDMRVCSVTITAVDDLGAHYRLLVGVNPADVDQANKALRHRCSIRQGGHEWRLERVEPDPSGLSAVFVAHTPDVPQVAAADLQAYVGVTVHSKTVIIDDKWAVIGSANIARRSLYTDIEHGVAMIDEDGALVREYRKQLWGDHFRRSGLPDDIDEALALWEVAWGTPFVLPPVRPAHLVSLPIPVAGALPMTAVEQRMYDRYVDLDSRQPWGGLTP